MRVLQGGACFANKQSCISKVSEEKLLVAMPRGQDREVIAWIYRSGTAASSSDEANGGLTKEIQQISEKRFRRRAMPTGRRRTTVVILLEPYQKLILILS